MSNVVYVSHGDRGGRWHIGDPAHSCCLSHHRALEARETIERVHSIHTALPQSTGHYTRQSTSPEYQLSEPS